MISATNVVAAGFYASLIASLGTALGSLGVLFIRSLSPKLEDGLLSVAAGIMLAASIFSLLLPSIEYAQLQYGSVERATAVAGAGLLTGAVLLWLVHRFSPHEHFLAGREGPDTAQIGRIWLFVIAITLHNFPEGMAVGVGFAGGDMQNGLSLMTGIAIQNIPEGLAISVSLLTIGYSRGKAFLVGALTGLAEPLGGLAGGIAVSLVASLIPWALAAAAGAMLFVISDEIIPETHRRGYATLATFALLTGFTAMLWLDAFLG